MSRKPRLPRVPIPKPTKVIPNKKRDAKYDDSFDRAAEQGFCEIPCTCVNGPGDCPRHDHY